MLRQAAGRVLGSAEPAASPAEMPGWAAEMRRLVSPDRLRSDVEALALPRNRLAEPDQMCRAQGSIHRAFVAAGWETEARPFEFTDVVGLRDHAEKHPREPYVTYERVSGVNIVATRAGTSATGSVLVGAHFDTVNDCPGADDNASGVAALCELSRVLPQFQFERRIVLAAFDMEEIGGFGSRALVKSPDDSTDLRLAVILESIGYASRQPGSQALPPGIGLLYPAQVGRLRGRGFAGDWTLVVFRASSRQSARVFRGALTACAGPYAALLVRDPIDLPVLGPVLDRCAPWVREFMRSDHAEFWKAGVPALLVTDTAPYRNPHYHRKTDVPETLDYEHLAAVVAATAVTAAHAAGLAQPVG